MSPDRPWASLQTRVISQRKNVAAIVIAAILGVHPTKTPQAGVQPLSPLIFRMGLG